jgi:hypothetical protein
MNAPSEMPKAPPAPVIDPSGSCAQLAQHRDWLLPSDGRKLLRALTKISSSADPIREHLCGVRIQSGNAIASDGHRLLCVIDYSRAEHLQGHTYTTLGGAFGLFGAATVEGEFPAWEALVPKLAAINHSLEIAFRSIPKVTDHTPVSIRKDGIALGSDPDAIFNVDLRYLAALPRTDGAFRVLVVDHLSPIFVYTEQGGWFAVIMPLAPDKERQSLVIPFEVPR